MVTQEGLAFAGITGVEHGVTATVGEVGAERQAGGVFFGIADLGDTGGPFHFHAFEVVLHDEVDDTGDSVRTVNGRTRTGGQDVDALDQRGRDGVEVDRGRARQARNDAAAVHQDQRTIDAQVTQVDGSDTGRTGAERGVGTRQGRRTEDRVAQQRFLDVDGTRRFDGFFADDDDRSDRFDLCGLDARAGNDDAVRRIEGFFDAFVVRDDSRVLGRLSERGSAGQSHRQRQRRRGQLCDS